MYFVSSHSIGNFRLRILLVVMRRLRSESVITCAPVSASLPRPLMKMLLGNPSITRCYSRWDILHPGYVKNSFNATGKDFILLTINVRGPSYLGLTRSISWLLTPWLLTSPGHQQPWYWLCRIGWFLSYLRKDFNYLCCINVEKWHNM